MHFDQERSPSNQASLTGHNWRFRILSHWWRGGVFLHNQQRPPRRCTLHTVAYNKHVADQDKDGQQWTETIHLTNNSCDEYQNFYISYDTELDMEPDTDENDIPHGAESVTSSQSPTTVKQINNRLLTVRIPITSGSHEAILVRRTPAAWARIIRSSA